MLIQTTLKNGHSFVTDCDDFEIHKNKLTGSIENMKWINCKTGKPIYLDPLEIVSVVRLDNASAPKEEES